eukprot:TRINITY_DN2270_c7_g1_i1.p1 TRINITY_DN2270_c7_g1~~TRINITY_DN2270_c7_g1_i1.p1  ORF type:complete len:164 (+),score=41.91 TRINITY_DN2270_c7_g1_i1:57-494(+)
MPTCAVCMDPATAKCATCSKGQSLYLCGKEECFKEAHEYQKGHLCVGLQCSVCGEDAGYWCWVCSGAQDFYLCGEGCFLESHEYQVGHNMVCVDTVPIVRPLDGKAFSLPTKMGTTVAELKADICRKRGTVPGTILLAGASRVAL